MPSARCSCFVPTDAFRTFVPELRRYHHHTLMETVLVALLILPRCLNSFYFLEKEVGDHFLALFPAMPSPASQGSRRVRGGSNSDSDASKSSSFDEDLHDRSHGRWMGAGLGFASLRGIKGLVGNIIPGRRKSRNNLRSSPASSSDSKSDEMETEEDKSRNNASPLPHYSQSQPADSAVGALPGVTYPEDNDEFEGLT